MADAYDRLPTEILSLPASDFWINAKIRQAGVEFEKEQRDKADSDDTTAGAASESEREELVAANEQRADARADADSATPDFDDQVNAAGGGPV